MKIFVAGATGVLGRALVPQLVARGHEVVGMTRSASKQDLVRSLGARPVVADALDPDAVAQAVASAEPEVIVHELTALSGKMCIQGRAAPRPLPDGDDDQPTAYRGDGPSPGSGPRRRGTAVRGAELRGVSMGPHRRAGADRGRSPRSQPAGGAAAGRWRGSSIWSEAVTTIEWGEGLVLRYGGFYGPGTVDQPGSGCGDGGADPQASVPDHRRRWWRLVARPHRRRRGRDRRRGRPRLSRVSTTSSTTSPRRCGSGCRCWRARWMPSHRGVSHAGWGGWRPVRRQR